MIFDDIFGAAIVHLTSLSAYPSRAGQVKLSLPPLSEMPYTMSGKDFLLLFRCVLRPDARANDARDFFRPLKNGDSEDA
eukprot:6173455-Pleurochrysis_carterae.AAC.2